MPVTCTVNNQSPFRISHKARSLKVYTLNNAYESTLDSR